MTGSILKLEGGRGAESAQGERIALGSVRLRASQTHHLGGGLKVFAAQQLSCNWCSERQQQGCYSRQ